MAKLINQARLLVLLQALEDRIHITVTLVVVIPFSERDISWSPEGLHILPVQHGHLHHPTLYLMTGIDNFGFIRK